MVCVCVCVYMISSGINKTMCAICSMCLSSRRLKKMKI